LISVEVVIWGLINLLRTTFASGLAFPGADTLSQALALIFVGVPIFAVHWLWAQKAAASDPEEHSATLRAIFLYAVLLATLIPVTQNILAFFNRTLLVTASLDAFRSNVGGNQTWVDNLIAIALNLLAAAYFFNILRGNWQTLADREGFADIRRLYRYIWVLYALLMTIFGTEQIIHFLFYQPAAVVGYQGRELFINGLAMLVVGTPVWVYTWNLCQKALDEPGETASILRLGVLYLLSLAGVVTVLSTAGVAIDIILRRVLGETMSFSELISQITSPISVGVPLAVIWGYYGNWLGREISSVQDEARRAALKRFYYYILTLIGLAATFVGLALLLSFIIGTLTGSALWEEVLRLRLCGAIATLLAGLPLWLAAWRPMQAEALLNTDMGDHARRSLVRRSFLYLVIFATVIGGMSSAIYLVYTILFGLLDHRSATFVTDVWNGVQLLGLFIAFLFYHWSTLRNDGGHAADALSARQARFAVLIFEPSGSGFAATVQDAIKRASPSIPVAVQAVEAGIPEGANAAQAVIISSELALNPPEALRLWLKDYEGSRLIVPVAVKGWYWPTGALKNGAAVVAQIVRQLAEGQEVRSSIGTPAWQMAAYIFAVLFGLQILMLLFSLGFSFFIR
jgi:hypothetical protein